MDYELAPDDIEATFKAIQSERLIGREALMAAGMIASAIHPGPVAYYGDDESRIPTINELVMLSEDYNDAIVNSLIMPTQPYLRDLDEWGREKKGGYWFITRAIADRIMTNREAVQGYVIPAQLPHREFESPFVGAESGVDFMADIFFRSITSAVPVTAVDLPGDILIVDAPADGRVGEVSALNEAVMSIGQYKNPELLAKVFAANGRGSITPLCGMWPSQVYDQNWESHSLAVATAKRKVLVADSLAHIIEGQLKEGAVQLFDRGRPLYENVLAMM
jgi:hypothetical protein